MTAVAEDADFRARVTTRLPRAPASPPLVRGDLASCEGRADRAPRGSGVRRVACAPSRDGADAHSHARRARLVTGRRPSRIRAPDRGPDCGRFVARRGRPSPSHPCRTLGAHASRSDDHTAGADGQHPTRAPQHASTGCHADRHGAARAGAARRRKGLKSMRTLSVVLSLVLCTAAMPAAQSRAST